jgi:allantoicase
MTNFLELVDLAAERLGGSVLYATDDFFASKDNLLHAEEAVFIPGKYTDLGKWMDGWESRRKRVAGHDWAILRLGLPGVVRGVVVDTAHFKGNYPQACSIEGASIPGHPDVATLTSDAISWTEILPRSDLKGDAKNLFSVGARERFTHLRLHIYPDGGVARLRVHGDVVPDLRWTGPRARPQLVDLAAAEHGAVAASCNDMFFGSRHNLLMPGRAVHMGDGWETKRSRRPGPDWIVVRLGAEGAVERAVVETTHFKGNSPESAAICVAHLAPGAPDPDGGSDNPWVPLLARTKLQPHTVHVFEGELGAQRGFGMAATHVRLRIWPDGGISRLRLFGEVSPHGRETVGMQALRTMPEAELAEALRAVCGASAWVTAMVHERSLASLADLQERAAEEWRSLTPADWDEAFRAHPRIGEKRAQAQQNETARGWSSGEQAKVGEASEVVLAELRDVNAAYEQKFGRIYIVCATGKSAEEMLALAKERMGSDPDAELRRAAAEQLAIMKLRLEKLVLR